MNRHIPKLRLLAALLVTLLIGAISVVFIQTGIVHASNRRLIVEHSEALYEQITFSTQTANVRSEEIVTYSHDGSPMPHLIVSITHEREEAGVIMDWNYRTGELIRVRSEVHVPKETVLPVLLKENAANATASWLQTLGFASKGWRWKLTAAPEHCSNCYTARWSSSSGDVTVKIQDRTGELIDAHLNRPN